MIETENTVKQTMSRLPVSPPKPGAGSLNIIRASSSGHGITPFAFVGNNAGNSNDFLSNCDEMSMPNDELASQNMISEPDEVEDSQASDYPQIKKKNDLKHAARQPHAIYEGGSSGEREDASGPLTFEPATNDVSPSGNRLS